TGHHDALADRIAPVLPGEIVVGLLHLVPAEHRPGDLRERLRRDDERLRRAALLRRAVRRIVVGRLRARVVLAVTDELFHSASGCLEGWARSKASSFMQASNTRIVVG